MTDVFQSLIDCLEDGIIILDRHCHIIQHNAAIDKLIQTPDLPAANQRCYAVLPCQIPEGSSGQAECPALQVFANAEPVRTVRFCEVNGQPTWYDVLISPLHDDSEEVTLAVEVWREIDEMRQLVYDARLCEEMRDRDAQRSDFLGRIIAAQEEERKRIARELHDETNQVLTALSLKVSTMIRELPVGQDAMCARLVDLKSGIESVMDNIVSVILDLRPSPLDDLGLVPALRWYASTKLDPLGIMVDFEVSGPETVLSNEQEITAFRVTQEAINNIVQHAGASTVGLRVLFGKTRLTIEVRDDGHGFQVDQCFDHKSRCRGLGLLGMRERLVLVGGKLDMESSPEAGTRLRMQIPLHRDPAQECDP